MYLILRIKHNFTLYFYGSIVPRIGIEIVRKSQKPSCQEFIGSDVNQIICWLIFSFKNYSFYGKVDGI